MHWTEYRKNVLNGVTVVTSSPGGWYLTSEVTSDEKSKETIWQQFLQQSSVSWKDKHIPEWRDLQVDSKSTLPAEQNLTVSRLSTDEFTIDIQAKTI